MEFAQKLKISQCLAFGVLFQYLGWLLKGLEVDESAVILGGKIAFALSYVLLLWGGILFADAKGFKARKGLWPTVGVVLLALGAWTGFMALVMKIGEALYLHKRFTGFVVMIIVEGRILTWLHSERKSDIQSATDTESTATPSTPV
ncbi:MAG: hypothetical protein ACAI34_09690 [Verrucomicrobium sp.]